MGSLIGHGRADRVQDIHEIGGGDSVSINYFIRHSNAPFFGRAESIKSFLMRVKRK